MSRAGYVLVGGRSFRMGRPKALLPYRGEVLGAWIARAVEQAAGSVTLVGDPRLAPQIGFPAIPDLYPGEGPLGGILTALEHSSADWNLLAACDMPRLCPEFLRTLLDAAEASAADALVPRTPSGLPQPLCAVYHRRGLPILQSAFARGIRQVTGAFEGLRVAWLETPEVVYFQNVNTPEEWAVYASE